MPVYLVRNPTMFIGFFVVLAKDQDEARAKAEKRIDADMKGEKHYPVDDIHEVVFDGNGIDDYLSGLE